MSKINNGTAVGVSRDYDIVVNGNTRNNYIRKDGTFIIGDTVINVSKYDTNNEIVRKINRNSANTYVKAEVTNNGIKLISSRDEVKINNRSGVLENKAFNDGRIAIVGKNSRTTPHVTVQGAMLPHRAANASEAEKAPVSSDRASKLDEDLFKKLFVDAATTTSKEEEEEKKAEDTPSLSTPKLPLEEDDKEQTEELGTDDDWDAESTSAKDGVDVDDEELPIESESSVATLTKKESKLSIITAKVTSKIGSLGKSIRTKFTSFFKKLMD